MKWTAYSLCFLILLSNPCNTAAQSEWNAQDHASDIESNLSEMPRHHGKPLADFLNPDGTLALPPEGIVGSLDPSGFRMVNLPGEAPRFEEAESPVDLSVPGDENWDSQFTWRGMNASVFALVWDGTNLYAGGYFTTAGGVQANHIAKWDGNAWSALGSGVNGTVYAFTWDGANLFVGGQFSTAGGVPANRVAKWDGSAWSGLSTGMNYTVNALASDGTNLYAGGYFTTAGGVQANYTAKWNGSAWSALGSGLNSRVHALAWDGTNLCAGGYFTTAGSEVASYVANWNGENWIAMPASGSGMNDSIIALAWDGTNLYAGGNFRTAGGMPANRIAKWDGSAWSGLSTGMNNTVKALAFDGTNLYAGGYFTTAGGVAANRIAKWDGSTWSALGSGMNSTILALSWGGGNLYAGGAFTTAGEASANRIARWDGSAWSALNSGVNGAVNALVWDGSNIYAGGDFTIAGGVAVNYIAKWDGSAWSGLSTGMNYTVNALAWDGANLYAGGEFWIAGAVLAISIAKWNGSSWSALGSGMGNYVYSLAWDGAFLYAGGTFSSAGGINVNRAARWNGFDWSALGSGVNNDVYALAGAGTSVYAGGVFTMAGGKGSAYIGRWAIPLCAAPSLSVPISVDDAELCAFTGVELTWPADAVDWGDGGSGMRAYHVLRNGEAVGGGFPYGTTQFTDSTGVNGTPYSYAVRYINGCGRHAATAGSVAADLSNAPGTPAITGISDANTCAQSGIRVDYSSGVGADQHDLYKDGLLAVTDYVSGATYNPGDTSNHAYAVRAVNADCFKDSVEQQFSDHTAPSPAINGPSPACSPASLSTQAFASYQWTRNGYIIYGATGQHYTAVASGTYAVTVTDLSGCQAASPGFMVNPPPATPAIAGPDTGCSAAGVELSTGVYAAYQWMKDGVDFSGATGPSILAAQSGIYQVRVGNGAGCTATSAGHTVTIYSNPQPVIAGDQVNACPEVSVPLSTGAYAGYQWYYNGNQIAGATGPIYSATVTGNYAVRVVDANGCAGQSTAFLVFVDFCPATEVSPASAIFPLRVIKNAASGTGYDLFFQRVDSTDGYNLYEGILASPWDSQYHHADQPGNGCGVDATDLGTGEMRSALAPSEGNRYYLVTAFGVGVEGPSGFDSMGLEIPTSQSTCTP